MLRGFEMKFFIDTADVAEIKKYHDMGVVDGVTTNPTLVMRSGRDFKEVIQEITSFVNGPVSAEVVSENSEGMVREAQDLNTWGKNMAIKIPMTPQGMKATKILSQQGIKTNVTLVFSANQALIAAKAGATFVSPFVGRLDDLGHNGMQVISDIMQIYKAYDFKTQVIVASIRSPLHVLDSAKMGAHIATIPPSIMGKLFNHTLTDKGIAAFLADWEKAKK